MTKEKFDRTHSDYTGLSRWVVANHLKTEKAKTKMRDPENKISQFDTKTLLLWLFHYIKSRFGSKADYPTYPLEGDSGIYPISDKDIITVVSDWATDTFESCEIATKMGDGNPDYTIHVGDTYYVGEPKEITANFLNDGCPWVRGSKGSFALLGNHEMYARGISFFRDLLPTLGLFKDGAYQKQKAGFFCLETSHWRILGLDTGYHSVGKPIIEMIFQPDCRLDSKLVDWLKNDVNLAGDKKGLVILTHHQYVTAFKGEREYQKPADQLADIIGKDRAVVWIWGHEHKFSMFQKVQLKSGVTAYGRCIGHGGMPVEIGDFKADSDKQGYSKLVAVDDRLKPNSQLGYNGYIIIKPDAADLTIQYFDAHQLLFEEVWHHDESSGTIKGAVGQNPGIIKPVAGKTMNDLFV